MCLSVSCPSTNSSDDGRVSGHNPDAKVNCSSLKKCSSLSGGADCPKPKTQNCVSGLCGRSIPDGVCLEVSHQDLCMIMCGRPNCGVMESDPLQINCRDQRN